MEPKLRIIRKKKSEAENAHLDPLMRALKALHSAGAPESMTAEELERQRRSQEVLGKLTAPMTGMDYEEFALSGMSAAWTRLKAPHGSRHAILYCHGGGYTCGNLEYAKGFASTLATECGVRVFCAAYRADEFEELLQYADHIVFNSPSQLAKFGPAAKAAGKSIGLRINPECSTQEGHEIYDPCAPGSRLGTTRAQWDAAVAAHPEPPCRRTPACRSFWTDCTSTLSASRTPMRWR